MAMASTSYKVLPVRLLGPGPATVRYLYIKPHTGEDSLPKDRAVYIAGVPAQLQGTALVELFARYGTIERAALHGSRVSAVLLYAAAEGRDKLLKAAAKGRPLELQLQEPTGPYGLKGEAGGEPGLPWAGDEYRHSRQSHPDGKLTRARASWLPSHCCCRLGGGAQGAEAWQCRAAAGTGRMDGGVGGGGGAAAGRGGQGAGGGWLDGGAAAQGECQTCQWRALPCLTAGAIEALKQACAAEPWQSGQHLHLMVLLLRAWQGCTFHRALNTRVCCLLLQGRKKNASATGVTVGGVAGAAAAAQLQAATKKDATHADFYRFQQREHRRNGGCACGLGHSVCWNLLGHLLLLHSSDGACPHGKQPHLRAVTACRAAKPETTVRGRQEADCGTPSVKKVAALLVEQHPCHQRMHIHDSVHAGMCKAKLQCLPLSAAVGGSWPRRSRCRLEPLSD